MNEEVIGFVAYVTNVIGNILVTRKSHHGFYVRIIPNIVWGVYAWQAWSWSIALNSITFFVINVHAAWKWRRESADEARRCGKEGDGDSGDPPVREVQAAPEIPQRLWGLRRTYVRREG